MTAEPAQRLLRTPDAALLLGLSARTLEKHRCYGTGPVYRKLGARVVYAVEDLVSWAEQGVRRSTSDPGVGTVHPARPIDPSLLERKGAVRR
jgi:predicted DNA-binding transcriptional regulator AlpA